MGQSIWWHRHTGLLFSLKIMGDYFDGKVKKSILISHPSFYICSQLLDADGFAKVLVGSTNEIRAGLLKEMQ